MSYGECCEPFHQGTKGPTAERLMRSRYSAYALGLDEYILSTWHPTTRPTDFAIDPDVRWYRLDILNRTAGGLLDSSGTVEFRAYFRSPSGSGDQHELSRFVRERGAWFYVDGS